ncbi:MAG: hypothetical protein EOM87_01335 [Clostridia bacterium]|nr:hypothetical protein [Clostridia bacterium]
MRKILQNITILILCFILILAVSGCKEDIIVDLPDDTIPLYTYVLLDGGIAPPAEVVESAIYDIDAVFADNELTTEEKVALMLKYSAYNETKAYRYSYFNSTIGTTSLSNNSGTLIYQRFRKQNLNAKYDVTLKLPVNHNFDAIAKFFVTDSTIRLVSEGKYFRMSGDDATYCENGLLSSGGWKKVSGKFNVNENISESQNYVDAQKSAINYDCTNIIAEGAALELIESVEGNYYRLTFSVDIVVANNDSATTNKLKEDNGGNNMGYKYLNITADIWTSGFMRTYRAEESWEGNIKKIYQGTAQSNIYIVFSYSERDNDMSGGIAIKDGLL